MAPNLRAYLQQQLTKTGAKALPYTELSKHAIEEHLVNLQEIFPSLGINVDEYCTNDGQMLDLLKAEGTIPVHFQGSKYNIPITIWLPEEYPVESPIVFVVPTHSMIIKPGHPQVNSSGQAYTPSLCTWHPSNNLVDLAFELSECFGKDPPLYAKPSTTSTPPPPATPSSSAAPRPSPPPPPPTYAPPAVLPPTTSSGGISPPPGYPTAAVGASPYASGAQSLPWGYGCPPPPPPPPSSSYPTASNPMFPHSMLLPKPPTFPPLSGPLSSQPPPPPPPDPLSLHPIWGAAYAAANQPPSSSAPSSGSQPFTSTYSQPPPPPPPPAATLSQVNARFKELAVGGLVPQLQAAEAWFTEQAALETNGLLETQRTLMDRRSQLEAIVRGLKQEREGTEGLVTEMGSKSVQLKQWLDRNKPKAEALEKAGGIDWDSAVLPSDELGQQVLHAQAEDLAIEDTIVALDKALHIGLQGLTLDIYLKQMRALCRHQFFARALSMKAAELQRQQQQLHRPPSSIPPPLGGVGLGPGQAPLQPPPQPPMMVPTQALAGASQPPGSQPPPQPPLPPYGMASATSNPMQPTVLRPMQSRPMQPYPKVQR